MKLLLVGVDHENLNQDDRKLFHFKTSDKLAFSTLLLDDMIDQTVIISTCNRSEVYSFVEDDYDERLFFNSFIRYFHQEDKKIYLKKNNDAILHLLEVACGLRSMVIGEDQIIKQLKEAYQWSFNNHFTGKQMNYLFNQVFSFAKKMKREHAISSHPLSVSYLGYLSIKDLLNPGDKIMICGSGEMAQLMMEYLNDYNIYVVNRTYDHVSNFLNEKRTYVHFDKRYDYLDKVKCIISATGAPHLIFKNSNTEVKDKLFLDLSLPRDVDKNLSISNQIIDMDYLQNISINEFSKRKDIANIIKNECKVFVDNINEGLSSMQSDDIIRRMQERYLHLSEETYDLLTRKIQLSQKEEYLVKKILKNTFLRLLKDPIFVLKQCNKDEQKEYIEMLEKIILGEYEK